MKKLIINADDFWMSKIYNQVIIDFCAQWKITSVSIMTRRSIKDQLDQVNELKLATKNHNISLGLHLDFWSDNNYEITIWEQISEFKDIVGFLPNHIDVHKDIPNQGVLNAIIAYCNYYQIPMRNRGYLDIPYIHTDTVRFVAITKSMEEVQQRLMNLEDNKTHELVLHPWKFDPDSSSNLNKEREADIEIMEYIANNLEKYQIELISFKDLSKKIIIKQKIEKQS